MKKRYVLFFIMIMSICVVACGKKNQEQEVTETGIGINTEKETEIINTELEVAFQTEQSTEELVQKEETLETESRAESQLPNNHNKGDEKTFEIELQTTEVKEMIEVTPTVPAKPPVETPASSESSVETTEKSTETPEKPTEAPEKSTETPEKPTEAPEKPTETPEKPTETPEKPTEAPEKPTETPESPTDKDADAPIELPFVPVP